MMDARSLRRLEAMDIGVWQRRRSRPSEPATENEPTSPAGARRRTPRIRLEAGGGPWLLVVEDVDRSRHERLLGDIIAVFGAQRCRFGSWSDSPESGVAVAEWSAHGIRGALVFEDREDLPDGCIAAGALEELARAGSARRRLWGRLRTLLQD
ncbi:MAG: hypothetical protein ACNS61_11485 [Candidatus Wenzhouxiangella sp. M2_3B_020]